MSFERETVSQARKRVTIRDVAARAGVSTSTVSYVINDSGPVAAGTRALVTNAIRELGFEPNQSARSLKRPRVSSIGLIVPELRNAFFALLTEGVQEAAFEHDVVVVLCSTGASAEREDYYASMLKSQRLDGVLYLSGTGVSRQSLIELAALEPIVFVDERLTGMDVPWVGSDNRGGARAAAEHLLEVGHRHIGIIGGPPALWSAEQRLAGYREAMAAAGIDPDDAPTRDGDYRYDSGYKAAGELLSGSQRERLTAILCANDLMAFGVIRYCRENGLRIPEDVSLVGFDDIPAASLLSPPLSTVRQAAHEMGRLATELLLKRVGGEDAGSVEAPALLPTSLQARESVGPPP